MTDTIFIQVQGGDGLLEAALALPPTPAQLLAALTGLGLSLEGDARVFVDDEEEPLALKGRGALERIRRGCRLHIVKCPRIKVAVHFLGETEDKAFAPGVRVKRVKAWAVERFRLDGNDAAEHVLQLCNATDRPVSDTPLHALTRRGDCAVCFDLVPEKRVEGAA